MGGEGVLVGGELILGGGGGGGLVLGDRGAVNFFSVQSNAPRFILVNVFVFIDF